VAIIILLKVFKNVVSTIYLMVYSFRYGQIMKKRFSKI